MVRIKLSRGKYALVDESDAESLMSFSWHAKPDRNTWYARRTTSDQGSVLMHRQILGCNSGFVDHINRNGLDNRRSNLRITTRRGNAHNRRGQSKYGPCIRLRRDKGFFVRIQIDGKVFDRGYFQTPGEARKLRDKLLEETWPKKTKK